jgi:hypothetical protein
MRYYIISIAPLLQFFDPTTCSMASTAPRGILANALRSHIVAKSPIARIAAWAHESGWENLSLLSTAGRVNRA